MTDNICHNQLVDRGKNGFNNQNPSVTPVATLWKKRSPERRARWNFVQDTEASIRNGKMRQKQHRVCRGSCQSMYRNSKRSSSKRVTRYKDARREQSSSFRNQRCRRAVRRTRNSNRDNSKWLSRRMGGRWNVIATNVCEKWPMARQRMIENLV